MKKRKKVSGVNFEDNILIISNEKPGHFIVEAIYQMFLVFFGVYGSVLAIAGGLELPVRKGILAAVMLLSVLYYYFIFRLRKYFIYTFPITLFLVVLTLDKYWTFFINGFYHLENVLVGGIYQYFGINYGYFVAVGEKETCLTMLLLIYIQAIAFLFTLAVQNGWLKFICFLILGISLGGPLFVGKIPPLSSFFLSVLFILLLLETEPLPGGFSGRKINTAEKLEREYQRGIRLKTGLYTASAFLALGLLVWLIGSDSRYQGLYQIQQGQAKKIEAAIQDFSFQDFWGNFKNGLRGIFETDAGHLFQVGNKAQGGLAGGKLNKAGSISFTNETALKLTLPENTDTLYLKGFVGTHYTGENWKGLTNSEQNRYEKLAESQKAEYRMAQEQINMVISMLDSSSVVFLKPIPLTLTQQLITIDYITANQNFLYLPYAARTDSLIGMEPADDSYYYPLEKKSTYLVDYNALDLEKLMQIWSGIIYFSEPGESYYVNDDKVFREYAEFEERYREFVYQTYASEPEGVERLKRLALQLQEQPDGLQQEGPSKLEYILHQIQRIKNYLEWQTTYSLSPGDTPENVDFTEYFLFDSRKGYCAHYASAAVLLLRSLHIPARYVEGYVVTEEDIRKGIPSGKGVFDQRILAGAKETLEATKTKVEEEMVTVEVKDTNAHAWIEVYLDGFGWMPFEVTAGYSADGINSLLPEVETAIGDGPEPTRLPTNTPTPTPRVSVSPIPSRQPSSSADRQPEEKAGKEITDSDSAFTQGVKKAAMIVAAAAVVYAAVVWGLKERRKHIVGRMRQKDSRRAALAVYEELERLLKVMSVSRETAEGYLEFANRLTEYSWVPENFENCVESALQARFSKENIDAAQMEEMYGCYEKLRATVYRCRGTGWLHHCYLKYILAV